MVNSLIVFDENEEKLGYFFKLCREDLDTFFNDLVFEIDIVSNGVFSIIIKAKTDNLKQEPFIFSAFTHGDNDSLLQDAHHPYITITDDLSSFDNSFIYAYACKSGDILGQEFINFGSKCFIGYNRTISIWNTWMKPFVNTATYGLKLFYNGSTVNDVYNKIKELYNEEIDKLYKNDFVIASILMENRDALVIYGDKNLDINNFKT